VCGDVAPDDPPMGDEVAEREARAWYFRYFRYFSNHARATTM